MKTYKFSDTAIDSPPDILGKKTEQEFLHEKYTRGCSFGLDNLQKFGTYKYMGWCFDFRHLLKKFLTKQYDSWQEYYAPNKTALRNSLYGKIEKIVEIS